MRVILFVTLAWMCLMWPDATAVWAASEPQHGVAPAAIDSDHDGLSDDLEQALLVQFVPSFMVDRRDCSNVPAEFTPMEPNPTVLAENSTIYGQVFPWKFENATEPTVEIHYYHLWTKDCGRMGHDLDTEHISVLIRASGSDPVASKWRAMYWYSAAHEDTVCDASQIARASTLNAEEHGPIVWISAGKHASFLNEKLCSHGCGGDICEQMAPLSVSKIVNLGESAAPMNGALWISSPRWPLMTKMTRSDFPPTAVAKLERLPASDIAWVNPARRPAQGVIAAGGSTVGALETSDQNTDAAISLAGGHTGDALNKTYRGVKHSLKVSVRGIGKFLGYDPPSRAPK